MRTTEQLGRYTLTQEDGLPKLGRDSLVLAEFATLRDGWKVCDLGCGVGVLGLLSFRQTLPNCPQPFPGAAMIW